MGVSPRPILVDLQPGPVAESLVVVLGDRARPRTARTPGEAVDVVASLDPAVLVVAPPRSAGRDDASDLAIHGDVVERTRWWCDAAAVTGAFVVFLGTSAVFDDHVSSGGDERAPDEFTAPAPTRMPGRAWRAAETIVAAGGGAVVRSGDSDPGGIADLVAWAAAARRPGTWHVGGPDLDDLHTRVVRDPGAGETPTSAPS